MSWSELARLYQLVDWPSVELVPRYNIAPTQEVPVIVGEPRHGVLMRWGFPGAHGLLINARSETVSKLPAFRESFQARRCLVPADGFYEWKKLGRERHPYLIELADGRPFSLAGIHDGQQFVVLTTTANPLLEFLHTRMPVILPPESYSDWLQERTPENRLQALLTPYPGEALRTHPVSQRVNHTQNDDAGLLRPVQEQRGLFD